MSRENVHREVMELREERMLPMRHKRRAVFVLRPMTKGRIRHRHSRNVSKATCQKMWSTHQGVNSFQKNTLPSRLSRVWVGAEWPEAHQEGSLPFGLLSTAHFMLSLLKGKLEKQG